MIITFLILGGSVVPALAVIGACVMAADRAPPYGCRCKMRQKTNAASSRAR
jgi:hypothetical protein